jgi:hypothetical protein
MVAEGSNSPRDDKLDQKLIHGMITKALNNLRSGKHSFKQSKGRKLELKIIQGVVN